MLKNKKMTILIVSVLAVLLLAVAVVLVMKYAQPQEADPGVARPPYSNQEDEPNGDPSGDGADKPGEHTHDDTAGPDANPEAELDPATVGTLDIEPLGITISYVKGVGGFEYEVRRTPSGTQYADFKSEDLVGTKCTNDSGDFASILVSPKTDEQATLTKKVEVEGVTYGLSLASAACTSNTDLLKSYQASFSDAFGLIKKIN